MFDPKAEDTHKHENNLHDPTAKIAIHTHIIIYHVREVSEVWLHNTPDCSERSAWWTRRANGKSNNSNNNDKHTQVDERNGEGDAEADEDVDAGRSHKAEKGVSGNVARNWSNWAQVHTHTRSLFHTHSGRVCTHWHNKQIRGVHYDETSLPPPHSPHTIIHLPV